MVMAPDKRGPNGLSGAQLKQLEEMLHGCERALHILGEPAFPSNRKIRGLQTVFSVAQSTVRHLLVHGVEDDPDLLPRRSSSIKKKDSNKPAL
jgi:hypothetical protein